MSQAHDDIPDIDAQLVNFRRSQAPKATGPPQDGTEAMKQEATFVVGLEAKFLRGRTSESYPKAALL